MSLKEFNKKIDDRRYDEILEYFNHDNSAEEVNEIHKDLSTKSVTDIDPKYRKEIIIFLESSLMPPFEIDETLDNVLAKLLTELRDLV
jgi:hypothetical protein